MATGEYVSVQSQADAGKTAIEGQRAKLQQEPPEEQTQFARIYVERGLDASSQIGLPRTSWLTMCAALMRCCASSGSREEDVPGIEAMLIALRERAGSV